MELRARTVNLARPRPPMAMPPVTKDTALISELENDTHTHRFLRGTMCFLVFLAYILSVFQIESYAGTIIIHVLLLLLSLAGEVCLYFIFRIKARFAGFTNPAMSGQKGGQPSHVSVLHSPHLGPMLLEMLLWIIQCPPGVPAGPASNILDSFILLRSYVFFMYLSQLGSRSVFKRAIASLCGIRFDSSYIMRYNFLYHSSHPLVGVGFVVMWMCLALLHAKAENKGFGESVYFCFNTATFVGYGDYAPRTFTGRLSAFFSLCLGLMVLSWFVAIAYNTTKLSAPEINMRNLFYTNKLCAAVPGEAARVIQRAWKLYVAKKEQHGVIAIQFNAFWLSAQAASFRSLRRRFTAAELSFLRSTFSFEDALTALTPSNSRITSRTTSPATTPRNIRLGNEGLDARSPRHSQRRPYSMYQTVKSKESLRNTPRAADPGKASPLLPPTSVADREGTQAPGGPLQTQSSFVGSEGGNSAQAAAAVLDQMKNVESQLDELIRRAQRISRNMIATDSLTEVSS